MAVSFLFDEVLFDWRLYSRADSPLTGWPTLANTVDKNETTGIWKTNVSRYDGIEMLTFDLVLKTADALPYLLNFWRGGYGSGVGFRLKVPWDYTASGEVVGTITTSQTKTFRLCKTYTRPGVTARQDVRYIVKPVVKTNLAGGSATLYEPDGVTTRSIGTAFAITVGNASSGFTYTINNTTGLLSVTTTSASGTVRWTGEFDIPAAFVGNALTHRNEVDSLSRGQTVEVREVLPAELGITVP